MSRAWPKSSTPSSPSSRNAPLGRGPYRFLWIVTLTSWVREGGRVVNVSAVNATAVNNERTREIIGFDLADAEDSAAGTEFLLSLPRQSDPLIRRTRRGCRRAKGRTLDHAGRVREKMLGDIDGDGTTGSDQLTLDALGELVSATRDALSRRVRVDVSEVDVGDGTWPKTSSLRMRRARPARRWRWWFDLARRDDARSSYADTSP